MIQPITKGTRIFFPDPFEAMDPLPALPREIRKARESGAPPPFDWDTHDTEPAPPPSPEDDAT